MFTILEHLKNRYLSQKAQGIVEYALLLAFVVVVAAAITGGGGISESIEKIFSSVKSTMHDAANPTPKS